MVKMKTVLPMIERQTLDGVRKESWDDFKGLVWGENYLHMIEDNLSRWPEVELGETMSIAKLRPALERSFGMLGIPEMIIYDGGPP